MKKNTIKIIAILIINTFFCSNFVFANDGITMLAPNVQIGNVSFQNMHQRAVVKVKTSEILDIDGLKIPIKIPTKTDIITEQIKSWVESKQSRIMKNTITQVELSSKQVILDNTRSFNSDLKKGRLMREVIFPRVDNFLDFFMNQIKNKDFSDIDLRIINDPDLSVVYPYPAFIDNKFCVIVPLLWLPDKNGNGKARDDINEAYRTATKIILDVIYEANKEKLHFEDKQLSPQMQAIVNSTIIGFDSQKKNLFIPDMMWYWSNLDIKVFVEDFLLPNLEPIGFEDDFDVRIVDSPKKFGKNVMLIKYHNRYTLLVSTALIPRAEVMGTDFIFNAQNDLISRKIITTIRSTAEAVRDLDLRQNTKKLIDKLELPDEAFILQNSLGWVTPQTQEIQIDESALDRLYKEIGLRKEKIKSLNEFFEKCCLNLTTESQKNTQVRVVMDDQRQEPYLIDFQGKKILIIPYSYYKQEIEFKDLRDKTFLVVDLKTKQVIKENFLSMRQKYHRENPGIDQIYEKINNFIVYFMDQNRNLRLPDIDLRFVDDSQIAEPYIIHENDKPTVVIPFHWFYEYKLDIDNNNFISKNYEIVREQIMEIISRVGNKLDMQTDSLQETDASVDNKTIVRLDLKEKTLKILNWRKFSQQVKINKVFQEKFIPALFRKHFYEDFKICVVEDDTVVEGQTEEITFQDADDQFRLIVKTSFFNEIDPEAVMDSAKREKWQKFEGFLLELDNLIGQYKIRLKKKKLQLKTNFELIGKAI